MELRLMARIIWPEQLALDEDRWPHSAPTRLVGLHLVAVSLQQGTAEALGLLSQIAHLLLPQPQNPLQ